MTSPNSRRRRQILQILLLTIVVAGVVVETRGWVAVDDTHLAQTAVDLPGGPQGGDPAVSLGGGPTPVISAPSGHPVYLLLGLAVTGPLGVSVEQIDLSSATGPGFTVPLAAIRRIDGSAPAGPGPMAWSRARPWSGSRPGSSSAQLLVEMRIPTCAGTVPQAITLTQWNVRAAVSVLTRSFSLPGPAFALRSSSCS